MPPLDPGPRKLLRNTPRQLSSLGLSLQELALISPRLSPSGLMMTPFPKAANSRARKSTKQHVTLPRKLPGKEEPLLRAESLRLAHSIRERGTIVAGGITQ